MRHLISCFCAASISFSALAANAQVAVTVDASSNAHPISSAIYGLNFPSETQVTLANITAARWGGNSVTRYNYEIDVFNTGADYYFENIAGCWEAESNYCATPPGSPKEESKANQFLAFSAEKEMISLFTIPTIGWVSKPPPKYSHPFDCGCPKTLLPNQSSFDPYDDNCGDGLNPVTGEYLDCGAPSNTSVATSPDWAKQWVSYIVQKFGPSNGKRIYALDNEPALWRHTHRDIRKDPLGYDELWERMRDYSLAILEADPTAEIAGPAEWGWPNYFCSDKDNISQGCSPNSPDRAAHGGSELVAWLLSQAKKYEDENGKRILHYLDLHYYPQGGNPPEITRSLWDPSYVDPSWIGDAITLLPRMRSWVADNYPGTKLAISEYDFYSHNEAVGAVTYAEVLGLFGREGVHLATAWSPPNPDEIAFAAYKLFRNYDGEGSAFESTGVYASADVNSGVNAYASAGTNRLTIALVNENPTATSVTVTINQFEPSSEPALFYNNEGTANLSLLEQPTLEGQQVTLSLPPVSIGMLVIAGKNPNPVGTGGSGGVGGSGATGGTGSGAAGGSGSGAGGGGSGSSGSGDCGCRAVDSGASGAPLLLIMVGAMGAVLRRRKATSGRRERRR
ncbi:MAG: glycoside hydrolase family 44 protein [Polyangiaceae bacterium]|nr:glycoside hydrolase family 44 protein [Polyangiaceae bacterium]